MHVTAYYTPQVYTNKFCLDEKLFLLHLTFELLIHFIMFMYQNIERVVSKLSS